MAIAEAALASVKMPTVSPALGDVAGDWSQNPHLTAEVMTPLSARITAARPALVAGLQRLEKALGRDVFVKYFESLRNLTQSGKTLLMVADGFRHRALLEREYIPAVKEAFGVEDVRVVAY